MHNMQMATWNLLYHFLRASKDEVTLTYSEMGDIVGGMPASASKYRAWWGSGRHSHYDAWTKAGFDIKDLQMGKQVTFYRVKSK